MQTYAPGTRIGQYEIASRPMLGGMGVVYFALDHGNNGRPVALKTFKPEYLPDRAARDRFLREGTTWVKLGSHPHIVRCYAVQYIDPIAFLALELIAQEQGMEDASLRAWLGAPMPLEQALLFALQIARGLTYAHTKIPGFVHRDLKPENVLVSADRLPGTDVNRLRVTDFGLVAVLPAEDTNVKNEVEVEAIGRTRLTLGILGTPLYIAPEQWKGESLGVYTDVYALGCILYEMLTGQRAAPGRNISELQVAHCSGKLRPMPASSPTAVKTMLLRCLALRPEERYQTWEEVIDVLEQAYAEQIGQTVPGNISNEAENMEERRQAGYSYNAMGVAYLDIGKVQVATKYFEKALAVGREMSDKLGESGALINLGLASAAFGDAQRAIGYYKQALVISREIGDWLGEGNALHNLGNAYFKLGHTRQAIDYDEQALAIERAKGDRRREARSLGNLGSTYMTLGDVQRGIGYYELRVAIARELGDRRGEGITLNNIGEAYRYRGDTQRAIEYFEQALLIIREIGNRRGEPAVLGNLGLAHIDLGDVQRAIGYFEQSLEIEREVGDRYGEGLSLDNLGNAYHRLGNTRLATEYYERALTITREVGNQRGERAVLIDLGIVCEALGDAQRAIDFYEQALQIARKIGDLEGEAQSLFQMAVFYSKQRDRGQAVKLAQEAVQIFEQTGSPNLQTARNLVAQLQGYSVLTQAAADQVEPAMRAFERADSFEVMKAEVVQYPVMKNERFIQAIQKIIKEKGPAEYSSALEERLAWLKQIAEQSEAPEKTVAQRAEMLKQLFASPINTAFQAFQIADSLEAMQEAAKQHPLLQDERFVLKLHEILEKQMPAEQRAAFEERLLWLKQISSKQQGSSAPMSPIEAALNAFRDSDSLQSMQVVVRQYPMLKEDKFIRMLEKVVLDQARPELRPAFEQRLAWLKQIAGKQQSGLFDRLFGKKG